MGAGEWKALASIATLAAIDPEKDAAVNPNGAGVKSPWHGNIGQHAVIDAWCSAVYDDATGTMYIGPAGGHGDYGGNERYQIRLSDESPAWTMYGKPTGAIGNTGILSDGQENSGIYFDGAVRSFHTYNSPVWVPELGQVIPRMQATYQTAGDGRRVFRVDPSTGAFAELANYSDDPGYGLGNSPLPASAYDPKRHCIWTTLSGSSNIQKYDITKRTMSLLSMKGSATGGNCTATVYIPEIDSLLCISALGSATVDIGTPTGLLLINLTSLTHRKIETTGSWADGFSLVGSDSYYVCGAQWDSVRHRLVLWHNSNNTKQISTLTPGINYFTSSWTKGALTPAPGGDTPSVAAMNGTYGRFALSPRLDGVFLLNGVSQPVYFYAFS